MHNSTQLYGYIINGVKFDIDTVENITNTEECNERILQLLQTKLGFYTNKSITDDFLRYILRAFPTMVKNKGSKKSLYQAIYVFLKLNHITTPPIIEIRNKDALQPYSITIYIQSSKLDTTPLDEMLRYLLPTGYTYTYVFYKGFKQTDAYDASIGAQFIAVSNTVNSRVRAGNTIEVGNSTETLDGELDYIIGAVDTTEVIAPKDIDKNDVFEVNDLHDNLS